MWLSAATEKICERDLCFQLTGVRVPLSSKAFIFHSACSNLHSGIVEGKKATLTCLNFSEPFPYITGSSELRDRAPVKWMGTTLVDKVEEA